MSRASRGDRYLTAEEREQERVALLLPKDGKPRVGAEIARHPGKSFVGQERAPDLRRADERGAVSIVEPVFSDYRLGFFPIAAGAFEVRRLPNRPEPKQ